jgi:OFA family oxalate/formate antiporter-like MFS transporter
MLQKWFPDRRGPITGIAVAGFGFGPVVTAPLAQALMAIWPAVPSPAFLPLGSDYLVAPLSRPLSFATRHPQPLRDRAAAAVESSGHRTLAAALRTRTA